MDRDRGKQDIAPELLSKDEIEQKVIQEIKEKLREGEVTWAKSNSDAYQGIPVERIPVILTPDLSRVFIKDVLKSSTSGRDIARWLSTKPQIFHVAHGCVLSRRQASHSSLQAQKDNTDNKSQQNVEHAKDKTPTGATGGAPLSALSGEAKVQKKKSKSKMKRNKRATSTSGEVPVGYVPATQARHHSISIIKKYPLQIMFIHLVYDPAGFPLTLPIFYHASTRVT
jgi:hypothetical protein